MLRIISGKYKRRVISQPPLEITRPSKDSTKEGLFSSLRGNLEGKSFLDVFSGSGAIGIEAYSEGAAKVTLIEKNRSAYRTIVGNLLTLGIFDIRVINDDYRSVLKSLDYTYDYIFLDPPYEITITLEMINEFIIHKVINEESVIIIEAENELDQSLKNSYNFKEYKYGRSKIYILRSKNI
ncbi:MAG TPA: 16S rRNA (guanine(966)-N(2))-methyltransferase RsmD [Candidatus Onthovivens sp.]|nr:16S rRNA (guanine(966)-N(2))-methyltransferase RsmD [Candidatus Onthovivens sp.]